MAGQQFQYDEDGSTCYYFLASLVALIVIPATYYLWPRDQSSQHLNSQARVHGRCPWYRLKLKSQQSIAPTLRKAALLFVWFVFLLFCYKVSTLDREHQKPYNPYEILNLKRGSPLSEIKRAYHTLSLTYHPDKGGDEAAFISIARAYTILTNAEIKQNWERFGNPDGPGEIRLGIALPAWIVDKNNSMLVLLVYGLVFMVIIPVIVGQWWYRSTGYNGDILINTTQLFLHFMYKTPNMNMRRLAMILTAACEFDPNHSEATIRPTDNTEVPELIHKLGNIDLKKEPPFHYPYSLKARVLVLAHLARMKVSDNLEEDQRFVLRKCPALLQEMVTAGSRLTAMAYRLGGKAQWLVSIENAMKLSQMIVQGLQENKSPLLQLPYIEEEHLRFFISRKRKVQTLQDLAALRHAKRRSMLHFLEEEKYDEVMAVLGSFPHLTMETKLQVLDDEDSHNITPGSIATVTVTLTRKNMADLFEKDLEASPCPGEEVTDIDDGREDLNKSKAKLWQKDRKTKSKNKKQIMKKSSPAPALKAKQANGKMTGNEVVMKEDNKEASDTDGESNEGEAKKDSPSERDKGSTKPRDTEMDKTAGDEGEEWEALQQSIRRRNRALLDTKSKVTHPVYSLRFPEEKQEWWWLYIVDHQEQTPVSIPQHVCTLRDTVEVELQFQAPSRKGNYQCSVVLRSDSYMGLDQIKPLNLEVHEAKVMPVNEPQWDIPESEGEDEEVEDSNGESKSDGYENND